jgi:hypothetical protein
MVRLAEARLAEIAYVRLRKDKKINLLQLIMDNYQLQETVTNQELLIRKLNDRR